MSCKIHILNNLNPTIGKDANLNGTSNERNENNQNRSNQLNQPNFNSDELNARRNDVKCERLLNKKTLAINKHVLVTGGAGKL